MSPEVFATTMKCDPTRVATVTWIKRVGLVMLSVVIMALLLIAPQWVQAESHVASPAAQWIVNTAIDENDGSCSDGDCSLRDAIAVAAAGDNITFAGDYTIYLNSQLNINKPLAINGSGRTIKISGDSGGDGSLDVQVFHNSSTLTLTHLNIVSGTNGYGGGIYNDAVLAIKDSTLSGNSASTSGGGIYNLGGTVTVQNTMLSGNWARSEGGGIYNFGTLTLQNSTLSNNTVTYNGGGIYFANYGTLTVANSTFANNSSTNGFGGGIYIDRDTLTIRNSTFSGNFAPGGGGIYSLRSTLNLYNTVIANNTGGDCWQYSGSIGANDHNLIESIGNDACGLSNGVGDSLIGFDPLLATIANYGGATQVLALLPGSPALNAGNNATCLSTDQRGVARPQPGGGTCDIGAFESQGFSLIYGNGSGQTTSGNALFSIPLSLTVTQGSGEPVNGGIVIFTGPDSGASIKPPTHTAMITGGVVSQVVRANNVTGTYIVSATTQGNLEDAINFNLTNLDPKMVVLGNGVVIANGDTTPSTADHTDFGGVSGVALTHTFTISNSGWFSLTINGLSVSGVNAEDFTVSGLTTPLTVPWNSTRTFQVRFTPSSLGAYAATVAITSTSDDGDQSVYDFAIQGAGVCANRLSVANANDSGPGSLRQAIDWACNDGLIDFAADASISLTSTLLITRPVMIDGGGHAITLDGNHAMQVLSIGSSGTVTLSHLNIMNGRAGSGGGIYNGGTLLLQNSTVSGNKADGYGGGIASYGALRVENSTLSGNSAYDSGGGLYTSGVSATLVLLNSTLSGNWISGNNSLGRGGGLNVGSGAQLQYWNTIIANSSSGSDCANAGTIVTNVNNLVEDGSCSTNGVNFLSGDPWLGPLADNGGGTPTHALLPGSLAIESGDDATCLATDQRGVVRPQMTHCDIGAYEASPQPVIRLTKSVTPALNIPIDGVVTYTLALRNGGDVVDPQGQLTDTLPYGMEFKQWVTQPGGAIINGNTITWTTTMLVPHTPLTLTFQATRTAEAWGNPIVNTAYFSGTTHPATASAAFSPVCAATLTVYSLNDSGPGSLRQAISGICPDGRIDFAPTLAGQTISLVSQLLLDKGLTVDGSTLSTPVTLSGNDAVNIFHVSNPARVTLGGLTLSHGKAREGCEFNRRCGGALAVDDGAIVTLTHASVISNTSGAAAITSNGSLNILGSAISGNRNTNALDVWLSCTSTCATSIISSTFSGSGVSISSRDTQSGLSHTVTVSNSLFSQGSLYLLDSTATIQNSSFINNSNGLSVSCSGATCLTTVSNSTFAGNGTGVYNEGGKLILQNDTLSGNGRGLYNSIGNFAGTLYYTNTIIANSTVYSDCVNNGIIAVNNSNLVEDGSCSSGAVNFQSGDPNLGTLADNGGPRAGFDQPMPTFSLLPGSKALNTGSNLRCPASDQRGQPRSDGQCDRGAYERGSLRLIGSVTPTLNAPYHGLVTYTLVLSNAGATDPNVWLTDALPPTGFTFERWIVSPTHTTVTDSVIGWQGVLTNGTALTWTFQARNIGGYDLPADYGDTVINAARAGNATDVGIRTETVLQMSCGDPLTVQNLKNEGTCSLRAVAAAAMPGSTVVFRPEVAGQTIHVSPTLVITKDLTIDAGALAAPLVLNGNFANRVMQIAANNRVTLNHLTLMHGYVPNFDNGGGLLVESGASLTLTHCLIYSNTSGFGGGLYSLGTLLVQHSAILSNTAQSNGSGIYSRGRATVQDSTISGNIAIGGSGGGIEQEDGTLTVLNSTISGNPAFDVGGIYLLGRTQSSSLLLENSTVSENRGLFRGGIYSLIVSPNTQNNVVTLINSTLFDNYVDSPAGYSGYIDDYNKTTLNFSNTIIASQWGNDCGGPRGYTIGTNLNNFVGDGTCSANGVNFRSGDPLLAPLADNGGETLTNASLPGSPLVDGGDAAACPATDQRGVPRPQGTACDIGAYEAQINLALTKAVTPAQNVPYHGTLTYTLVLSNAGELGEPNMLLTDTLPSAVAFGAWVTQPAGTVVRAGNTLTWTGALNAHSALTFTFTATHVGLPREWVTNTAYFSATTWAGSASAGFLMAAYIITPTAGSGGSITPSTAQVVNPGEDRSFTITPDYGYHLLDVGVDGISIGAVDVYTFTNVTADHTITATFDLNAYALTTNVVGQGQITRTPDQATYLYGSVVTLTAVPQPGWYFGQWLGDASGTLTQTTVLMDANKVVTATFFNTPPTYYTLTLSLIGSGVITPTVGAHTYLSGTVVSLSASPDVGWKFSGWSGDADCTDGSVTLNANKSCMAVFARYQVYLPLILK